MRHALGHRAAVLGIGCLLSIAACSEDRPTPAPEAVAPVLGAVAWTWQDARLDSIASVAVGEDTVVALGERDGAAALSASSREGDPLWQRDDTWFGRELGSGPSAQSPVTGAGMVAVALADGSVAGLDADDGREAWSWGAPNRRTTLVGAADATAVVRVDPRGGCASGPSTVVALDLSDGEELWSRTTTCDLRVDGELVVVGGEVLDPGTGEVVLEVPGTVCGVAGGVALWMEECPGAQLSVEGTPTLAAVGGTDTQGSDLPTLPSGRIAQVRSGLDVLAAVYEPGSGETRVLTRAWVPGSVDVTSGEGPPEGALVASDGAAFTLLARGSLLVRALDGTEVGRLAVDPAATDPGALVQVAGTGPDYVLLAPSSPGTGHLLVSMTLS